jgi:predicted ATPase
VAAQTDARSDPEGLAPPVIRTPDQRLRIFVSSTLRELAPERKSARAAIERLHLAPVMFELGARPHPPRELYRAYLQQSHVFVGLYWERYGWVAPGEEVSGLEDEYNLAPTLPKLIYIKEPADSRDAGLTALLTRIRDNDNASFKYFSTPDELGELLEADLATMLAESFERSLEPPTRTPSIVVAAEETGVLPHPLSELVGREREVDALVTALTRERGRLLTLTGPGGIGKSRLAIDVGNRVGKGFPGGVWFVDLSTVHDAALVPTTIAQSLGVRNAGDGPLMDKLTTALAHRKALLVIDNFEQVLDAATTLSALLAAAPEVSMLVTSRMLLRVSGERNFEVGPLGLPALTRRTGVSSVLASASAALFVERARAVKPDFEVTAENVEHVARICIALEGVPLALELAAARIRILPPAALVDRLDRGLALLAGGARDLPARQQTLRSTIEWSTQLLREDELLLLEQLGIFAGGFSLEAAEDVCVTRSGRRVLDLLETLVDSSLVRQQDRGERPHFTMLATVREYALERLAERGQLEEAGRRHATHYLRESRRAKRMLDGAEQADWAARLADERDNLRAAERFWLDHREWAPAAEFAWNLYLYWWIGGHLGEVRAWMDEVLESGDDLPDLTRAEALYFTRAITFWQDAEERIVPGLTESAELFHVEHDRSGEALALVSLALAVLSAPEPDPARANAQLEQGVDLFRHAGDRWGEAMAFVTRGRVALLQHDLDGALAFFTESLALTRLQRDDLGTAIALHHLGWVTLLRGGVEAARAAFDESLAISARLGHVEGVAYGLEGFVGIAAASNDAERAGRLLGASESLRQQTGLYNAPSFSFHEQAVRPILASSAAAEFERARSEGRTLSLEEAVSLALPATVVQQRSRTNMVDAN